MKKFFIILMVLAFASSAYGFSENFDSFTNGHVLDGTMDDNGWKGWDNDASWGAFVTNAQALSGSNSVAIAGSTDLVHEFSGVTSGLWNFSTSVYVPSGSTGTTYFILMNQYADGGTKYWGAQFQLQISNVTGTLIDDFSGASRSISYDDWVQLNLLVDLDNNTVNTYYGGSLFSTRTWNSNNGGPLAIAAVDLYANGASAVYYDNISLTPTPIPAAIWLLGSGLLGLIGIRRRYKK